MGDKSMTNQTIRSTLGGINSRDCHIPVTQGSLLDLSFSPV